MTKQQNQTPDNDEQQQQAPPESDATEGAETGELPDNKPAPGNSGKGSNNPPPATAIAELRAAKRIKRLESDIASLQDVVGRKQGEIDELQAIVGAAAKKPGTTPGKSVLDELNDFLGV